MRIVVRSAEGDDTTPLHLEVPEAMMAPFRWLAEHAAAFAVAELASRFPALPLAQHLGIVNALARALPQATLVRPDPRGAVAG